MAAVDRRTAETGTEPEQVSRSERRRRRREDRGDDAWFREFGAALRALRLAAGVSEEDAAAASGRSAKTWRNYERTGRGRLLFPIYRFAERYGLSLEGVFVAAEKAADCGK